MLAFDLGGGLCPCRWLSKGTGRLCLALMFHTSAVLGPSKPSSLARTLRAFVPGSADKRVGLRCGEGRGSDIRLVCSGALCLEGAAF